MAEDARQVEMDMTVVIDLYIGPAYCARLDLQEQATRGAGGFADILYLHVFDVFKYGCFHILSSGWRLSVSGRSMCVTCLHIFSVCVIWSALVVKSVMGFHDKPPL